MAAREHNVTSSNSKITIGTRKSPLAMWQAEHFVEAMRKKFPDRNFQIEGIVSEGDMNLKQALSKFSDKGVFTKELDRALLSKQIDLAVHSMKDLPTLLPKGIRVCCVLERGRMNDAFVLKSSLNYKSLAELPKGSVVGTSSQRRRALLAKSYPDIVVTDMRGNVNTRLDKLDEDECSGILLAAVGLERVGMANRITEHLSTEEFPYAVGQGALVVVGRINDTECYMMANQLNDMKTLLACTAERAMLRTLQGGCKVPIAVRTSYDLKSHEMELYGCVVSLDGKSIAKGRKKIPVENLMHADFLGCEVASLILEDGGQSILDEVRVSVH